MVEYKGVLLARNSEAYELWEKKDFKKLEQHMKELDQRHKDLLERYSKKEK